MTFIRTEQYEGSKVESLALMSYETTLRGLVLFPANGLVATAFQKEKNVFGTLFEL